VVELTDEEFDDSVDFLVRSGLIRQRPDGRFELTGDGHRLVRLLRDPTVLSQLSSETRLGLKPPAA
jgi:hypothetical protein